MPSITFGKEVTADVECANGARLLIKTDDGHLTIKIIDPQGVEVEAKIEPIRGVVEHDGQYACLVGIEGAAGHARHAILRHRAPQIVTPASQPRSDRHAVSRRGHFVSDRQRATTAIANRKTRAAAGAKFVLFADENDLAAKPEDLVLDRTIPLASSEHAVRMIAAKRLNRLRGSEPSSLWTKRLDGAWRLEDFEVQINEHGHYVVSAKPGLAREFVPNAA